VKVIGIAGASGTGKSTVAAHLAARGGVHVDADAVGHEVLESDAGVVAAVRERIGPDVFDGRGRIDRRLLGERVFTDAAALSALNAIIHPVIRARCGRLVESARRKGAPFVVVDAALLLDSKMPFAFDLLIALRCDEEARFRRIMAKGGWSEEEVRRRLASQRDLENSFYKADVVVDTDGDKVAVLEEIDRLVDGVLRRDYGEDV